MTAKQNIFMVLDTETADLTGNVYDIGYTICDKHGAIMAEYNALVREVFTNADRMMGAFYAKKIFTHYAEMLDRGTIKLRDWDQITRQIRADVATYGVTCVAAYNAGFDLRVMKQTQAALSSGSVFTTPVKILDIWQFACETKLQQKAYKRIALEQGWVSDAGNIRTGAEYAYRFCSGDFGFIEDHTALSDARIESEILAECFRQKKRVPYGVVNAQPWRLVNAG